MPHDDESARLFAGLVEVWNGADPESLRRVITDDYQGHMLHLPDGHRTADKYGDWIARYRRENPGVHFHIVDQVVGGDRVCSRLVATKPDGLTAHGMNISRLADGRIAEEWAIWSNWSA